MKSLYGIQAIKTLNLEENAALHLRINSNHCLLCAIALGALLAGDPTVAQTGFVPGEVWLKCNLRHQETWRGPDGEKEDLPPGSVEVSYFMIDRQNSRLYEYNEREQTLNPVAAEFSPEEISHKESHRLRISTMTNSFVLDRRTLHYTETQADTLDRDGATSTYSWDGQCQITSPLPVKGNKI